MAARLLTLVLVPVVALTVLAIQRIDTEQQAALQARRVVEGVELQRAVAEVYPYANLERIALEGLARIDELHVPRPLVTTLAGIDLETVYSTNAEKFDDALDQLTEGYRQIVLPDGESLGNRLRTIRLDLQTQRTLSDQGVATRSDVFAVFESLNELLEDTLDAVGAGAATPSSLTRSTEQLGALSDVLVSAGDYGQWVFHALVLPSDDTVTSADRAYAAHVAYLDMFEATLDEQQRADLEPVRSAVAPFLDPVPTGERFDATEGATDFANVQASTDAVLGMLDYLAALQQYSLEFTNR